MDVPLVYRHRRYRDTTRSIEALRTRRERTVVPERTKLRLRSLKNISMMVRMPKMLKTRRAFGSMSIASLQSTTDMDSHSTGCCCCYCCCCHCCSYSCRCYFYSCLYSTSGTTTTVFADDASSGNNQNIFGVIGCQSSFLTHYYFA